MKIPYKIYVEHVIRVVFPPKVESVKIREDVIRVVFPLKVESVKIRYMQ